MGSESETSLDAIECNGSNNNNNNNKNDDENNDESNLHFERSNSSVVHGALGKRLNEHAFAYETRYSY